MCRARHRRAHVQIDKAGQDIRRVVCQRVRDMAFKRSDAAVFETDRAVNPAVRRQNVSFQHEVLWKYAMRVRFDAIRAMLRAGVPRSDA